jgi:hypothetical protein
VSLPGRLTLYRAALRNYASRAFLFGNPNLITAAALLPMIPYWASQVAPHLRRGEANALSQGHINPIFVVGLMGMASVAHYYWQQVGEPLAAAVPRLLEAELAAGLGVTLGLWLALATPMVWAGLPLWGSVAFVAMACTLGAQVRGDRGEKAWLKWLGAVLLLLGFLVGLIPQWQTWLIFMPAPGAIAVMVVCAASIAAGMSFHAGRSRTQGEARETREARKFNALLEAGDRSTRLGRLMRWQPAALRQSPMPPILSRHFGPVGIVLSFTLSLVAMIGLALAMAGLFTVLHEGRFGKNLHDVAPPVFLIPMCGSFMSLSRWLMVRKDWPFFFMAGRYGERAGFAQALFRAYRINVVLLGAVSSAMTTMLYVTFHFIAPVPALEVWPALFAMFVGGSYASSIPLLWREFGGKGMTILLTIVAYLVLYQLNPLIAYRIGHVWIGVGAATVLFIGGLVVSAVAPRRLAVMDWPIDAE